jgi:hypothetical protein
MRNPGKGVQSHLGRPPTPRCKRAAITHMLELAIISSRGSANLALLSAAAKMDSAGRFAEMVENGAGLVLEAMERRSSASAPTGASVRSLIHVLRAARNTLRTAAAAANFISIELAHNKGKAEAVRSDLCPS